MKRPMLALELALCLSAAVPVGAGGEPGVSIHYRTPDLVPEADFRPLLRTSLLIGTTEFLVVASDPDGHRVAALEVFSDTVLTSGRRRTLCRSAASSPARCGVDLGNGVGDDRLRLVATLIDSETGLPHSVEREISVFPTLADDARKDRVRGAIVERTGAHTHPYDYVTRSVWVSRTGTDKRREPVLDLEAADFRASARGLGEVRILSVQRPDAGRACVVPLIWNVSSYLRMLDGRLRWTDEHAAMVLHIREGFRAAALRGFDCEALVVEYAATARALFGAFRLHGNEDDGRVLDALAAHLSRPPPQDWSRRATSAAVTTWRTDFLSVYHTLNDLLRGYPGLKSLLLVTDGNDLSRGTETIFQHGLWPERIRQLNAEWRDERLEKLLLALDAGVGETDRILLEFVQGLVPEDPGSTDRIAAFLARVDPGGLSSLQAHRKDLWPRVDALILPSVRVDTKRRRRAGFVPMVGGNLWTLRTIRPRAARDLEAEPAWSESSGEMTLDDALVTVAERIRQSYEIALVVPNPRQDRRRHDLKIGVSGRSGRRLHFDYMPAYSSSPPLSEKMKVYMAAPHKELRLLAAYELRRLAFDEETDELVDSRWRSEPDAQVRRVLFESWISIRLQRLHEDAGGKRSERARAELLALVPEELPDPLLATAAKRAAER
jgi:hypothetical protein